MNSNTTDTKENKLSCLLKSFEKYSKAMIAYFAKTRSMLYFIGGNEYKDVIIAQDEDLQGRILLRHKIAEIAKNINGIAVEKCRAEGSVKDTYLRQMWDNIYTEFLTINQSFDPCTIRKLFFNNESKVDRNMPNCLSAESMKLYIDFLNRFVQMFRKTKGYQSATSYAHQEVCADTDQKIVLQDPVLPASWQKIYEKMLDLQRATDIMQNKKHNDNSFIQYDDENE